ncbi:hypothetical protein [Psychrobacillus sp. BL-248-WT-3]|uniref:hypothetical protein n=1 Tax=Psychrobacillus sp. BL-248-WT-3 TaxID=2725306 RepID=UPI00146E4F2B|nr:hypothetical protein [Psychrobacillus sp. BL-248-WT-3]NME06224.1 DUF5320 domain-containing protein [Psychrobacillus sp. BL-248-WT-3]
MENQDRFAEKLKQAKILYLENQEKTELKRQLKALKEQLKTEQREKAQWKEDRLIRKA